MIYILRVDITVIDAHTVQISHVIKKNRNFFDVFIVHPPFSEFLTTSIIPIINKKINIPTKIFQKLPITKKIKTKFTKNVKIVENVEIKEILCYNKKVGKF